MRPRTAVALATLIPALAVGAAAHGEEQPPWVQAAAAIPTPTYGKTVHAVALAAEAVTTAAPDGTVTRAERHVVRILERDGAGWATGSAAYDGEASKVRTLRAWLIRPGEAVRSYGGRETLDVARTQGDVYNEARAMSRIGLRPVWAELELRA